MFGLSLGELLVIATVAILVLGPQDLPKVVRTASKVWRSVQLFMHDIRQQMDAAVGQEELAELRALRESLKSVKKSFLIDEQGRVQETYDISDLMVPKKKTETPHLILPDEPAALKSDSSKGGEAA